MGIEENGYDCSESKCKTIFLLDWDDTLLCSSTLKGLELLPKNWQKIPTIPTEVAMELSELQDLLVNLLTQMLLQARVVIITAAQSGWVEQSAKLFLPQLAPIIMDNIKIVSARQQYEDLFPGSPCKWKIEAFHEEVLSALPLPMSSLVDIHNNDSIPESPFCINYQHVISIGDSCLERTALQAVRFSAQSFYGKNEGFYAKSMKLIDHPSIKELKKQLELILKRLDYFITHEGDFDIHVSKDMIDYVY